jgi:hypothetical protein
MKLGNNKWDCESIHLLYFIILLHDVPGFVFTVYEGCRLNSPENVTGVPPPPNEVQENVDDNNLTKQYFPRPHRRELRIGNCCDAVIARSTPAFGQRKGTANMWALETHAKRGSNPNKKDHRSF